MPLNINGQSMPLPGESTEAADETASPEDTPQPPARKTQKKPKEQDAVL